MFVPVLTVSTLSDGMACAFSAFLCSLGNERSVGPSVDRILESFEFMCTFILITSGLVGKRSLFAGGLPVNLSQVAFLQCLVLPPVHFSYEPGCSGFLACSRRLNGRCMLIVRQPELSLWRVGLAAPWEALWHSLQVVCSRVHHFPPKCRQERWDYLTFYATVIITWDSMVPHLQISFTALVASFVLNLHVFHVC